MKQGTVAQTYTEHFEDSGRKITITVSSFDSFEPVWTPWQSQKSNLQQTSNL